MFHKAEDSPTVLISSSMDLLTIRDQIKMDLKSKIFVQSSELRVFLWEESTNGGMTLGHATPVQRQVDLMLGGQVIATIVMFGERIGEPLRGELPDRASRMLKEWQEAGLRHPWPESVAEQRLLLDQGCFPLTGTVYELLAGIQMELEFEDRMLRIGYVTDKPVIPTTVYGDTKFNGEKYLESARPAAQGSTEQANWIETVYRHQIMGIVNLFAALRNSKHNTYPIHFDDATRMAATLGGLVINTINERLERSDRGQILPSDLRPILLSSRMPFPDRTSIRRELKEELLQSGRSKKVLFLTGASGCGKSSLLQKGLLGDLPKEIATAIVIAIRPGDFTDRPEKTPLFQFLAILADALDEAGLGGLNGLRNPKGAGTKAKIDGATSELERILQTAGASFALGVDQFEEILDLASMDQGERRDTPGSWWQVIRFISRIVAIDGVYVAATLETQRENRLAEMAVQDLTGLRSVAVKVDFSIGDVRKFVKQIAGVGNLALSDEVIALVEKMVESYEKDRARGTQGEQQSSFLPLLTLWLNGLLRVFQDRREESGGVSKMFGQSTREISLDELRHRGVRFDLAELVAELIDDAWEEADACEPTEVGKIYRATDWESFRGFLNDQLRNGSEAFRRFILSFNGSDGFSVDRFCIAMARLGHKQFPGVESDVRMEQRPSKLHVSNFLNGLVGVHLDLDAGESLRLLDMPEIAVITAQQRLITAHLKRRLLERVGNKRVRLVHQATIDHWEPGRTWYDTYRRDLSEVNRLQLRIAQVSGESIDFVAIAKSEPDLVTIAAKTLNLRRAVWLGRSLAHISEREKKLRQFCRDLLAAAPDGSQCFELDGAERKLVYVAAACDLGATLDRWLNDRPELIDETEPVSGNSLLMAAAWGAESSVSVLMSHSADPSVLAKRHDEEGWHAIAGAIQSGNRAIFEKLYQYYESPAAVCGPAGITILHEAARAEHSEIFDKLIDATEDIDVKTSLETRSQTPLFFAIHAERTPQVLKLLEKDASLSRCDGIYSPLCAATSQGRGDLVTAILENPDLSDTKRAWLLYGDSEDNDWQTPLVRACASAKPEALRVLLKHCDPTHKAHRLYGRAPIVTVVASNNSENISTPLSERVTRCVRLLLRVHDTGFVDDVFAALEFTEHLPDARRLIEDWLVRNTDLSGLPDDQLREWLTGGRPGVAISVLEKRPDLLDQDAGFGATLAAKLASEGNSRVLLLALRKGFAPKSNPELFRFMAGLRVLRSAKEEWDKTKEGESDASRRPDPFAGLATANFHPLLRQAVSNETDPICALLLSRSFGWKIWSPLHLLAMANEFAAFAAILDGMTEPVPRDLYGRLPSDLAPERRRAEFASSESTLFGKVYQ